MDLPTSFMRLSDNQDLGGKTWEERVIALEDCLGLCDLSPDQVRAISEHEHVPEILAAALGTDLLRSESGPETIRDMFMDDLRRAVRRRDVAGARNLVGTLRHFLHDHPEAAFRPKAA
jgi:hypothetical protein